MACNPVPVCDAYGMITLILLVFAFVLACIAAFIAPQPSNFPRLICAALAFYFLACIFSNALVSAHLGMAAH